MGIGDTYQENGTASIRENFEWDRLWWEHTEDNTKKRVLDSSNTLIFLLDF